MSEERLQTVLMLRGYRQSRDGVWRKTGEELISAEQMALLFGEPPPQPQPERICSRCGCEYVPDRLCSESSYTLMCRDPGPLPNSKGET